LNLWLRVFLPFATGYYFSYFLRNVNAVIAPELTRELGVSAADLGLLTSAYLLAFGAVQLPLGLALDRYGARRVEASLLLVAAAGCGLFAVGASLTQLAVARALIGLGVSACLMASFKAFSQWFGTERQASLNAAIMAAGGLGALTASTPLAWAIPQYGWRAVFAAFWLVAGLAVAVAIFSTPEKPAGAKPNRCAARSPAWSNGTHQPRLLALRAAIDPDHRRLPGPAGPLGGALADELLRLAARGGRPPPAADGRRHARRLSGIAFGVAPLTRAASGRAGC
jgi:MFS family permease